MINLKPISLGDAEDIYKFSQGDLINRWASIIRPKSIKDTKEVIREILVKQNNDFGRYFVILKDNRFVGRIALFDWNKQDELAEVGLWVAQDFWGQGIATEAISQIIEIGKSKMGLKKIIAEANIENVGSQKALEKNGFEVIKQNKDNLEYQFLIK